MNRAIFITGGVVLIIIIFLVWLFLFINGTPSSTREVFSDLGIVDSAERPSEAEFNQEFGDGSIVLNLADGTLQQITTNSIAGYGIASSTDGREILRFVERGTGHIFEVNLSSGLQTQLSPNTIAGASEAYFSPNVTNVAIVTELDNRKVTVIELPDNPDAAIQQGALVGDAENIQFVAEETITYTRNTFTKTTAYQYDLRDKTTTERFSLPLPDARVYTNDTGKIFAFPKPTAAFEGALYEVTESGLSAISQPGTGLIPFIGGGMGIVSHVIGDIYVSQQLPGNINLPFVMFPEKCTADRGSARIWCGSASTAISQNFLENWYKGRTNANDSIWVFNNNTRESFLLTTPADDIGRQVDVTYPQVDARMEKLFFINKIDSSLWLLSL